MNKFKIISFYAFVHFDDLQFISEFIKNECKKSKIAGLVILAKEGNLKRVKIGKCDKEDGIMKRFSSLNTSSPIDLKIIGYLKGYEKDWHRYFKEHRIKGEWFDFNKPASCKSNITFLTDAGESLSPIFIESFRDPTGIPSFRKSSTIS